MSSTNLQLKLTIKDICFYAEALKDCEATELTWADAKPYFVKYVRSTNRPLPFLEELDITDEALALDKAEAVTLVDLCYGNTALPLTFFSDVNRISWEDGVYTFTRWARETGATSCPIGLMRLKSDAHPKEKLVDCFNFVTNVNHTAVEIDIFDFNLRVRQFGAKFHHLEVQNNMLWCYKNQDDCKQCFASPDISDKTMREFCTLAHKKI